MTRRLLPAVVLFVLTSLAAGQQPMPPDKQAEVALTAGQKAYNDGNLPLGDAAVPAAVPEVRQHPAGQRRPVRPRPVLLNSPQQDFAKASRI